MKKMIITLLLATIFININACGGTYFDDGSRAFALTGYVHNGDVGKAQKLLELCNVSKEMRFTSKDNDTYKSMVGLTLELGWLAR